MLTLLFDLAYWGAGFLVGFWLLLLAAFLALAVADWRQARRRKRAWRELQRTVDDATTSIGVLLLPSLADLIDWIASENWPARAADLPAPFDRDDPLERQFALPSAPDPRVR